MNDSRSATAATTSQPAKAAPAPLTWLGWTGRVLLWTLCAIAAYFAVRLTYEEILPPFYAPEPAITVGHETTRIEGPLTPGGYVNYRAALEQPALAGLTTQNNGAVLFCEAIGPLEGEPPDLEEFYERLGMEMPPYGGDYLRELDFESMKPEPPEITRARQQHFEDEASRRPWTRDEFPRLPEWIDANAGPLDKIVAATKRPKWYLPRIRVHAEGSLANAHVPALSSTREAARILVTRALLRIGSGELEQALDDLAAIDRLAERVGRDPSRENWFLQGTIERYASEVWHALAVDARLSSEERARLRALHAARPARASLAECIDRGERFFFLDAVKLEALSSSTGQPVQTIDWNEPLRDGNRWFDSAVAALREPDLRLRRAAVFAWEDQAAASRLEWQNSGTQFFTWLGGESARTLRGRNVGQAALSHRLPALLAAVELEMCRQARQDLGEVAFALAEFRAARGHYPDQLAELVPEFLPAVPVELFSDPPQEFDYRRAEDSYVLFSRFRHDERDGVPAIDSPADSNGLVLRAPLDKRPFQTPR